MTGQDKDAITAQASAWFVTLSSAQDDGEKERHLQAFSAWLAVSPTHGETYDRLTTLWGDPAFTQALQNRRHTQEDRYRPPVGPPAAILAFPHKARPRRWLPRPGAAVAAALALVILGSLLTVPGHGPTWITAALADHATGTGEVQTLTLADGSKVTLNADSAIDIHQGPDGPLIDVLQGDVYFDVQPVTPGQNFRVIAPNAAVRVVGTAFTVSAHSDNSRVAVDRGIVEVTHPDSRAMVRLTQGQGTQAGQAGDLRPLAHAKDELSWVNGRLAFHDQPFGAVVAELGRYLPAWVLITDETLKTRLVSGSYRLDTPLASLQALASVVSARVEPMTDKVLIVLPQTAEESPR